MRKVCLRDHELTEDNIYRHPSDPGRSECLTCKRARRSQRRRASCQYCRRSFVPHTSAAHYCSVRCALHDRRGLDWRSLAVCLGKAPLFDDTIEHERPGDRSRRLAIARRICETCPVWTRCRTEGQALQPATGMWGGVILD